MRTISSTKFESMITYDDTTAYGYYNGTSFMTCAHVVNEDAVRAFIDADGDGREIRLYAMIDDGDAQSIVDRITISDCAREMYDDLVAIFGYDDLGIVLADCKIACTVDNDGTTVYMLIY